MGREHHPAHLDRGRSPAIYCFGPIIDPASWAQAELEGAIPSSTVSQTQRPSADPVRAHARALRVLLEKLDDLSKARNEVVAKVTRLAGVDDITPRILRAAAAMEQWVTVQPAMFEDILDEELAKYHKFRVQLQDDERQQAELLDAVKVSFRFPAQCQYGMV